MSDLNIRRPINASMRTEVKFKIIKVLIFREYMEARLRPDQVPDEIWALPDRHPATTAPRHFLAGSNAGILTPVAQE
jgi:hypothetical protein